MIWGISYRNKKIPDSPGTAWKKLFVPLALVMVFLLTAEYRHGLFTHAAREWFSAAFSYRLAPDAGSLKRPTRLLVPSQLLSLYQKCIHSILYPPARPLSRGFMKFCGLYRFSARDGGIGVYFSASLSDWQQMTNFTCVCCTNEMCRFWWFGWIYNFALLSIDKSVIMLYNDIGRSAYTGKQVSPMGWTSYRKPLYKSHRNTPSEGKGELHYE